MSWRNWLFPEEFGPTTTTNPDELSCPRSGSVTRRSGLKSEIRCIDMPSTDEAGLRFRLVLWNCRDFFRAAACHERRRCCSGASVRGRFDVETALWRGGGAFRVGAGAIAWAVGGDLVWRRG